MPILVSRDFLFSKYEWLSQDHWLSLLFTEQPSRISNRIRSPTCKISFGIYTLSLCSLACLQIQVGEPTPCMSQTPMVVQNLHTVF
jgi:hypothetical protein